MNDKKNIDEINKIISAIRKEISTISQVKTFSQIKGMVDLTQKCIGTPEPDIHDKTSQEEFPDPLHKKPHDDNLSVVELLVYKAIRDHIGPIIDEILHNTDQDNSQNPLHEIIEKILKEYLETWMPKNIPRYFHITMGAYCKSKIDDFFAQETEKNVY